MNIINIGRALILFLIAAGALISTTQVALAQTEQVSVGQSYDQRWRIFKRGSGTNISDPYIYVYSPEFAKTFKMPDEWVSQDLKGADAIAFRVIPDYATCGWGGEAKACRTDMMSCNMDIYFDKQKNPLPWDNRYPEVMAERYRYSSHFIPSPQYESRLPTRENDHIFAKNSPLVDPTNNKGLLWQEFRKGSRAGSWYGSVRSYDKNIFAGMSLITLNTDCNSPIDELWLTSGQLYAVDVPGNPQLNRRIEVPVSWQIRVKQAMQENNNRSEEFYKREGAKAIKAIREAPALEKFVIPIQ